MKTLNVPRVVLFSFFSGQFMWLFFTKLAEITHPAVEFIGAAVAMWLWRIIGMAIIYYASERNLDKFQTQALAVIEPFSVLGRLFSK